VAALLLSLAVVVPAFGQGGATSSITGVVVDSSGGAIPGVTVTAKNDNGSWVAVTSSTGSFTIPSLNVGKYTVTVTLQGFKTALLKDVIVTGGGPATVKPVLEIGGLSETVVVEGASQIIQTQSSAAATVVDTNQILNLPVGSRSSLDFVQFLPGVQTSGGIRDSTVAGLPQSAINMTLDGVSIQDNHLKTGDGFFARVSPRLDAIEEVSLTTAAQGADSTGQGSVQIKFTTRSGTNQYNTSLYHFYQNEWFNTNSYSNIVRNLPKGPIKLYQGGGRVGGPVVIPGLYDGHGKAFFFVNYEMSHQPSTLTSNATMPLPHVLNGDFIYNGGTVNLFALAQTFNLANPLTPVTTSADPTILKLYQDMRNSPAAASFATVTAITGNFNAERLTFQQPAKGHTPYPTVKLDYNLTNKHRAGFSMNKTLLESTPDTTNGRQATFPGFPVFGAQISHRYQYSGTLRSTISSNVVNEFRIGASGGPTQFSPGVNASMFNGPLASQGGYKLGMGSGIGLTNPDNGSGNSSREPTTRLFENTLTWLRGSHSLSMGASYTKLGIWVKNNPPVTTLAFGLLTGDPALTIFNTAANFPGSSSGDRNNARDLYATLIGSVNSVAATARLDGTTGQYIYNGQSFEQGRLQQMDTFVQDNWRIRPNLSINLGVRYAVQPPFRALNESYSTASLDALWGVSGFKPGCDLSNATSANCNLFTPGNATFPTPTYVKFEKGVKAYNTDWDNFAPSIGANWTPTPNGGLMQKIIGAQQGDTSLSAGWARAFERHGMSDFTGVFAGNPGINIGANRNAANGNILLGTTAPLLLRNGYLGAQPFCSQAPSQAGCLIDAPTYPFTNNVTTGSVNVFDPNIQVPYSDNFTVGWQRALTRKTAFEVRYVGTRSHDLWTTYNFNGEANIHENGFLNEFKLAQANLQTSIASGCGTTANPCTFKYQGPGTGTSPLPIYLAFLNGQNSSNATNTALYSGSSWTSSNFVNSLGLYTANPFTPAGTNVNTGLSGDPARVANAATAGLPRNFFRPNPDMLGGANATGQGGFTTYNSVQLIFRRRLSDGLQMDANYVTGRGYGSTRYSFRVPRLLSRAEDDVTHAFKMTWIYDSPFGRGKRFGTNVNKWVDGVLGGWVWSGTTRIQSGAMTDLGNVRIVGMTEKEARDAFHLRKVSPDIAYSWPADIIENTIKAFDTNATSSNGYGALGAPTGRYFAPANGPDCIETINGGYGDCGVRSFIVTGPNLVNMDMSLRKNINFMRKAQFQLSIEVFNALHRTNWGSQDGVGSTTAAGFQTGLPGGARTMQIGTRFTW
jgi:hypothetical protein